MYVEGSISRKSNLLKRKVNDAWIIAPCLSTGRPSYKKKELFSASRRLKIMSETTSVPTLLESFYCPCLFHIIIQRRMFGYIDHALQSSVALGAWRDEIQVKAKLLGHIKPIYSSQKESFLRLIL